VHHNLELSDYIAWAKEIGISETEAHRRLGNGALYLRDRWNTGAKDPDTFYKEEAGDLYIYDLTAWHTSGDVDNWFRRMYTMLEPAPTSRVLDYGAGIGSYSLRAAKMGHIVDACEINPELRAYVEWRARRHGELLNVVEQPFGRYDVVLCLDVIEHLKDPVGFPEWLGSKLNPNGRAMLTWTFHRSGGMHPMHCGPEVEPAFVSALRRRFTVMSDGWPVVVRKK